MRPGVFTLPPAHQPRVKGRISGSKGLSAVLSLCLLLSTQVLRPPCLEGMRNVESYERGLWGEEQVADSGLGEGERIFSHKIDLVYQESV